MDEIIKKYGHLFDSFEQINDSVIIAFEKGSSFSDGKHVYRTRDKYTVYVYTTYHTPLHCKTVVDWLSCGTYNSRQDALNRTAQMV